MKLHDRVQRRGTVYMLVLIVSMIVFVIGISGVQIEGVRTRRAALESSTARAALLAQSAVELGLLHVQEASAASDDWRVAIVNADATVGPMFTLGDGTCQWSLESADGGTMSTTADKPIHIVGSAWVGAAESRLRVIARPSGPALNCLAVGVFAEGGMLFESGTIIQSDRLIAANGDIEADSSSIFASVETAGEIIGETFHGTAVTNAAPRGAPDTHDVLGYYEENGTTVLASDLPSNGGARVIERVVLSPESNPFGAANPEGIYVIDCDGDDLIIRDCRVLGTLVITGQDGGNSTIVTGSCHMAPATTNFPCLLSEQEIVIALSAAALSESDTGANFNPDGTPYQGEFDAAMDDDYPSMLFGLVYSMHDVRIGVGYNRIIGCIVADDLVTSEPGALLELTYRPELAEDPPPGFFVPDGNIRIAAFSWAPVTE